MISVYHRYKETIYFKLFFLILFGLISLLFLTLDVFIGSKGLSLVEVFKAIFNIGDVSSVTNMIVWDIRLPMALFAAITGGILGLCGNQMQIVLANPLADPYTFGISQAASFGAALHIILGFSIPFIPTDYQAFIFAMFFCMVTIGFILVVSTKEYITAQAISLVGVAIMFGYNALILLLQFFSTELQLQNLFFWTMGSFNKAMSWTKLAIASVTYSIILGYTFSLSWALTALKLSDHYARSIGISVRYIRLIVLIMISILTGMTVSFVGTIGFIGLTAPHIASMIIRDDQRFTIILSTLVGSCILQISSIISKIIIPGVVFPITVITSIVGIPFFIYLVLKKK